MSPITDFLCGIGLDNKGRLITNYFQFTMSEMETIHDYIQWAFPTKTASAYNPDAPVLTDDEVRYIYNSSAAQFYLTEMAWQMVAFYRSTNAWLSSHDHNHLRISRILESLGMLVEDKSVVAKFYIAILEQVTWNDAPINKESLRAWQVRYDF